MMTTQMLQRNMDSMQQMQSMMLQLQMNPRSVPQMGLNPQQTMSNMAQAHPAHPATDPFLEAMQAAEQSDEVSNPFSSAQTPPPQATAAGGDNDNDPFSDLAQLFADAQTPRKPLTQVVDAAQGEGLAISLAFEYRNGPQMAVKLANSSSEIVSAVDIRFERNFLGILSVHLPLSAPLQKGASDTVRVALQLSGKPTMKCSLDAATMTVRMSARSMRSNAQTSASLQREHVAIFEAQIPVGVFFDNRQVGFATIKDKKEWLQQWGAIPMSLGESQTIENCKNRQKREMRAIFESNQFTWVANRETQGCGVNLYFASTLRGISVRLEVSISKDGKCRFVVKSKDKHLSHVACQAIIKLANA